MIEQVNYDDDEGYNTGRKTGRMRKLVWKR